MRGLRRALIAALTFSILVIMGQNCSQWSSAPFENKGNGAVGNGEAGTNGAQAEVDESDPQTSSTEEGTAGTTSPSASAAPVSQSKLITNSHRYAATAYGGWGPHLGHLLRTATNELWFVDDTGNDVNKNAGAAYYKLTSAGWVQQGFQSFYGTVQQNTGSVMVGNMIYTYGVDIENKRIEECYFDTTQDYKACNLLSFEIGSSKNYVGATVSPSGTRVVWWTGEGTWSYIYNYGGGWNGPVTSTVAGYPGFAYVYARLSSDNATLEMVGSAPKAYGGASSGYDALYGSTTLGNSVTNWALLRSSGLGVESWLDSAEGLHLIVYGANEPEIYYKAKGGALAFTGTLGISGIIGARIIETAFAAHLLLADNQGRLLIKTKKGAVKANVDWKSIEAKVVEVPAGLGNLTIYPESRMYQTTQPVGINLGINGYSNQGVVQHLRVDLN